MCAVPELDLLLFLCLKFIVKPCYLDTTENSHKQTVRKTVVTS